MNGWDRKPEPEPEYGSATVHAVTLSLLVVTLTMVALQYAALVRLRHEVTAAADLAALAGSQASAGGADGCAAARAVAGRNATRMSSCRMDYDVATVRVRGVSGGFTGHRWVVEVAARAAPEDYVPASSTAFANSASSRAKAPALSRGELPLPHFGD